MSVREKHTATFQVRSMDDQEYTIHAFTEYFDASTSDGPSEMQPTGRVRLQTADGKPVSHVGKGEYVIVGARGEEIPLISDDPNAP